jgi:CRP-like cAMP-binding protein
MLLLTHASALQRVSAFVLEMAERSPAHGSGQIALPMSRYDIADYLALSVETVSRAFTQLRQRGAIALAGAHRVRILDWRALGG